MSIFLFNKTLIQFGKYSDKNANTHDTITFPITYTQTPTVVCTMGPIDYTTSNSFTGYCCNITISSFVFSRGNWSTANPKVNKCWISIGY